MIIRTEELAEVTPVAAKGRSTWRSRAIAGVAGKGLLILLAACVMLVGIIVGSVLRAGPDATLANPGTLVELRTGDGSWLVGVLRQTGSSFIRLSTPAEVRESADTNGESQYRVALLSGDPYRIDGDAFVAREQVAWLGVVAAGSGLEAAYASVVGGTSESGSPPASPLSTR